MKLKKIKDIKLSKKTFYDYLCAFAKERPNRLFLLNEVKQISVGDALKTVEGLACKFKHYGVNNCDLVALRATRTIDSVLIIMALALCGAVTVLCDPCYAIKDFVDSSNVKIDYYITNETSDNKGIQWKVFNQERLLLSFDVLTKYPIDYTMIKLLRLAGNAIAPSIVIFTSGSTGNLKAVVHNQYVFVNNALQSQPSQGHTEDDIAIGVLPIFHIFGLGMIVHALVLQHTVMIPSETSTNYVLKCIQDYSITRMYCVPTYFLALIADGKHINYDLTKFRVGMIAGGPSTSEQYDLIEKELGIRLLVGYGMSEFFAVSRTTYDMSHQKRSAGVGELYPQVELRLIDDKGEEVDFGKEGEICVKGYPLMLGYYVNSEIKSNVDIDGFFHTGDLGYFDDNGILNLCGRKKHIIIRGGENISSMKVEKALLSMSGVREAAVVGKKDHFFGEIPVAIIACSKNLCSEKDVQEQLKSKLLSHEIPSIIRFVEELPKTSTGKIDIVKIRGSFH